jgi:ankyrin repeat protein
MAKKLLNRGANIDYVNREGKTVLVLATQLLRMQSIQFLLDRGANPHIEDLTGQDACDYAK